MAKRVIFKSDISLDALFSRFWERLKVFWTSHMSRYLIEQFRDNVDFNGAVRNVNEDSNFDVLFSKLLGRLKVFWTPHMSG